MKVMQACPVAAKTAGDAAEFAVAAMFHIARERHDSRPYDVASDVSCDGLEISVKASGFTLMAGSMCEGRDTFDGIWNLYAERVHSNTFAYVTADFLVYMMTLAEFELFVRTFCRVERESEKNGGTMKIRCRKESTKMLNWLATAAS